MASTEPFASSEHALQQLMKELDCVEAMVGLAEFSPDFEHFRRSYKNALQAYNLALVWLPQAQLAFEQQQDIHRRLSQAHKWLQRVGLALIPE